LGRCINYTATSDESRKKIYESIKNLDYREWKPPVKMADVFPAIVKGLNEYTEYQVREELFDKEWLRKITGLNY
jgi:hypothetical protein